MSYVVNKFNLLSSQAQFPVRYDNEKQWIKYYEKVNRSRKKYAFARGSLIQGNVGVKSSVNISQPNSLHSSTTNLGDSQLLAKSTVFH